MIDEVGLVRRSPYALALLRIVSGLIFLEHGTQKFLGFPSGDSAGMGWALNNPGAFAGVIELAAGILITIGLFTRPAAFIASGTMAVAYWMAHAPQNAFPVNNGAMPRFSSASSSSTWSSPAQAPGALTKLGRAGCPALGPEVGRRA